MKRLLILVFSVWIGNQAYAALPFAVDGEPLPSLAPMLVDVQPAVVNISTTTSARMGNNPLMQDELLRRFFGVPQRQRQRPANSLGSGVIIDAKKGYVVTNHHVIEGADEITVTLKDGRSLEAQVVGSDAASDIAVIQVQSDELTEIRIGRSEQLRVGDFVVAIGSPFGLSHTVTSGIVSALGRSGLGIEGYEDFIQTDASINPGNSGGALVNLRGELIGINTAILSRGGGSVGIGLSIPVDMVTTLMDQLIEHGEVKRGLLGVTMQDLTPALAEAFGIAGKKGALVSRVIPGSTAEDNGILEGDIIVKFNDTMIEDSSDLRNAVGLLRVGTRATVEFYREGKRKQVSVKIKPVDSVALQQSPIVQRLHGARFRAIKARGNDPAGILVFDIERGTEASTTGLREGDIIIDVNQTPVVTIRQMKQAIAKSNRAISIKLVRDRLELFIVIQ